MKLRSPAGKFLYADGGCKSKHFVREPQGPFKQQLDKSEHVPKIERVFSEIPSDSNNISS